MGSDLAVQRTEYKNLHNEPISVTLLKTST